MIVSGDKYVVCQFQLHMILEGRKEGYCSWNVMGLNVKSEIFDYGSKW